MKLPGKNRLRDALIITVIFFITRVIIFSSIVFIRDNPLSPDSRSYKSVFPEASVILPYSFGELALWADSGSDTSVRIDVNGVEQTTIRLGRKEEMYVIRIGNATGGYNKIEFFAEPSAVADGGSAAGTDGKPAAWRLWDLRTDARPGTSILKEHNMMYSQYIKTEGITGSELPASGKSVKSMLLSGLSKWDANQYAGIIYNGYRYDGDNNIRQNIVFPFLYPLLAGVLTRIGGINAVWAGAVINNLSFFISLFFIYYLSCQVIKDKILQFMPVILFCAHPFGVFLVSAYSEGLFVLLASVCLCFLYKRKYGLYALFGGALSAVRVVGAVAPLLLIFDYYVISRNKVTLKNLSEMASMSLVSLWGFLSFMLYSSLRFNEPFAMFLNQNAWTPGKIRLDYSIKHVIEPFINIGRFMEPEIMGMALAVIIAAYCIGFVASRIRNIGRLEYILSVFSFAFLIIPVVFYNKTPDIHMAMGRYTIPSYPVFILLSENASMNKIPYFLSWILFSVFLLVIMAMRFSWGYTPY